MTRQRVIYVVSSRRGRAGGRLDLRPGAYSTTQINHDAPLAVPCGKGKTGEDQNISAIGFRLTLYIYV